MFYRMGVRCLWQDVISRQNAGTWDLTNLFKYFHFCFVMSIDCMESESKCFFRLLLMKVPSKLATGSKHTIILVS